MAKLVVEGLEQPSDLVTRLKAAGFDLDTSVGEYVNRERRELLFVQDVPADAGFQLLGRRIFCGVQPQGSMK